jgi:hypothetical protein
MITDVDHFHKWLAREYEFTPSSPHEINGLEDRLGHRLPESYRKFLLTFGNLTVGNVTVLGGDSAPDSDFNVLSALSLMRAIDPEFPAWAVPVMLAGRTNFLCLNCSPDRPDFDRGPLLDLDLDLMPVDYQGLEPIGHFDEVVYGRIREEHYTRRGLRQLERRVKEFIDKHQYDHAKGGDLPRNHEWRPYRYCIQDVLFGSIVVRHDRDGNHLQVDVFLPVVIPGYEADAGAEALTAFLLSEAYKCGGTMEIRFSKHVEGGNVPAAVKRIAARHGVEISEGDHITPSQARKLYAAITGFSPELRAILSQVQEAGRISVERACYAIHHGLWSKAEVENLILGAQYPDSVLGGEAAPERRHIYWQDLQDACGALLGGALDRRLASKERQDATGSSYDLEDDLHQFEINFDDNTYAKSYLSTEDLPVPWLVSNDDVQKVIAANTTIYVLIRARDEASLQFHFASDLSVARQYRDQISTGGSQVRVFILVPSDFNEIGPIAGQFLSLAEEHQIGILVCPDSMLVLTEEAGRRLSTSRIIRND